MKPTFRRIALSASVAATMALAGAAPALGQGTGPKVVTGNPGKGATVIHCNRLPGGKSVLVITPKGRVAGNCRFAPGTELPPGTLPGNVLDLLKGLAPGQQVKIPGPIKGLLPLP
ncbi:MAG TPA: hypothetical protein VGV57_06205 [Thermoleophilaceae bacterium]|nr:hypothetical protein [Thermoleophilaceae bacterium]